MNDFMKDELEYLMSCPSVGCWNGLYYKIQSMIDNYCDHKDKQYYDKVEGYECMTCKKVIL